MDTFISYEGLPLISGGAHKVNSKSYTEIYQALTRFLAGYTNAAEPAACYVAVKYFDWWKDLKMVLRFGLPTPNRDLEHFFEEYTYYWPVPLPKAMQQFKRSLADTHLCWRITWDFCWIDPATGGEFPGQRDIPQVKPLWHNSQMVLDLSPFDKQLRLWLTFPFSELTGRYLDYIKEVEAVLPINFSRRYWLHWRRAANGTRWVATDLRADW